MNNGVVWALPINENKEYISSNVKYHCFEDINGTDNASKSMCGKYIRHDKSETEIESGEILSNPQFACKVCYRKWRKEFSL